MPLEPWRDQHPLEGPLLKLGRAEKHLKAIDDLSDKFMSVDPHRVVSELNADKTFYECRLVAWFPPFIDFMFEIGEFCYQVRSALDHIIFALSQFPASLSGKELAAAERTPIFPILVEKNDALLGKAVSYVRPFIRDDVRRVVGSIQPYHRGDRAAALLDPLSLLDEMGNADKHRVFKMLPVSISINVENLAPGIKTTSLGNAGHSDIIAWIPAHLDPKVDFYPRVAAKIVLPVTRNGGHVFMENLGLIHQYVRDTVLPKFEQFFDPLPASLKP